PLRPLFPEGMKNDVQILTPVLSGDMEVDPATTAINAASAALMVSGIPFHGPVGAVRIGYVQDSEGKEVLVVNPTYEQEEKGRLNLVVAGTLDAITMVEAGANEVSEDIMIEAMELAQRHIKELCKLQMELRDKVAPVTKEYDARLLSPEIQKAVSERVTAEMLNTIIGKTKREVKERLHKLEESVLATFAEDISAEKCTEKDIKETLGELLEENMRRNILEKNMRIDGRALHEIRSLSCQVGILPRPHGSALFQRGETQALTITTLGAPGAAQLVDTMDQDTTKRYMHYYNFPPYSVGEVKPMRGTSRREVGHGNLAERALLPMLPEKEAFPYTIRLVSEVLSCNGSSSMASICGSSLSLMDAGVPIKRPVAGIAMGLITDQSFQETGKGIYKILADIQGLEDFAGDMDFKVGGTEQGITALQMDMKVKGISLEIIREALTEAKKSRLMVLEKMKETLAESRKELSKYAPLIISIRINPDQIREVIGKGGETIQKITEENGVEIDIEDDGLVMITAPNQEKGQKALQIIKNITYVPKVGEVFDGTVTRIMEFGAFVEFLPGKEGLVHISNIAPQRINRVEDVLKVGDKVRVKLFQIDDQKRNNLTIKDADNDNVTPPSPARMPSRGGRPPFRR
ncbi:polyribonucleotide nucleotidyltransferase, partial [Candidatus Peregrinibacteria bacterium]|nr:polyribonucleotide nucleotidyltransferase [Candidatus Peregrinibacteria bacterium]